jgi:hypothetical protein
MSLFLSLSTMSPLPFSGLRGAPKRQRSAPAHSCCPPTGSLMRTTLLMLASAAAFCCRGGVGFRGRAGPALRRVGECAAGESVRTQRFARGLDANTSCEPLCPNGTFRGNHARLRTSRLNHHARFANDSHQTYLLLRTANARTRKVRIRARIERWVLTHSLAGDSGTTGADEPAEWGHVAAQTGSRGSAIHDVQRRPPISEYGTPDLELGTQQPGPGRLPVRP